jgi:hypothetical protein
MFIKWYAFGFYGKYNEDVNPDCLFEEEEPYKGYYNDGWNSLDFLVVLASLPTLFVRRESDIASLRSLRALKPLRLISVRLKILVGTILKSLRGLVDVLLLLMFLFVVFAIGAVQLFNGVLHRRCFSTDIPLDLARSVDDWQDSWTDFIGVDAAGAELLCSAVLKDNDDPKQSASCPEAFPYCLEIAPNPDFGAVSWDNVYMAMMNLFVIITLEGWVDQMYYVQDALSPYTWVFFVTITFLVSFFSVNLTLAVIEGTYDLESQKVNQRVIYLDPRKENGEHIDEPFGLELEKKTGYVLGVKAGSQCDELGVKEGWQLLEVEGQEYDHHAITLACQVEDDDDRPEILRTLVFTTEGQGFGKVDERMFKSLFPPHLYEKVDSLDLKNDRTRSSNKLHKFYYSKKGFIFRNYIEKTNRGKKSVRFVRYLIKYLYTEKELLFDFLEKLTSKFRYTLEESQTSKPQISSRYLVSHI